MKIKKRAEKSLKKNVRWQALKIIYEVEYKNQYSNILINRFLNNSSLDDRDERLLVQLVYGVIQHRYTLNYYLKSITKGKKIESWVKSLLRLSVYQLIYLDRIPEHAIVNEAVNIAKENGHQRLGKFVNALLRQFLRQEKLDVNKIEDVAERFKIKYSIQKWIVDMLLTQVGEKQTEDILQSIQKEPFVAARINAETNQREEILSELKTEGFDVEKSELSPYGIRCLKGNLIHSSAFKEGRITIQDESSMLVAPIGNLSGDEHVLDACSAPGGKATHIARLLKNGHLDALDISAKKLFKVEEHAKRLHLDDKITTKVTDASKFIPENNELYDMIYLDAPCSGLGLLRRKPEIKYEKSYQDVISLVEVQLKLLNHLQALLKSGGTLIYSTCTLSYEENEQVINDFIKKHTGFVLDPIKETEGIPKDIINDKGQIRIYPNQYHTDGFFIARLIKQNT